MYYDYKLTISAILKQTLQRHSNREVVYGKTRYTWPQFFDRVQRLASGLERLGVRKGSKIAMVDVDTNRYLEAYFAVPMMGAILHTVNVRLPLEQIGYTISHAEDDVLLIRDEFLPMAARLAPSVKSIKAIVTMSDSGIAPTFPIPRARYYEDLLSSSSPHYDFPDLDENTTATMFYTSGTTGFPKGVWFTHRQLVLHTLALTAGLSAPPLSVTAADVVLPLVPFFHVHGWGIPYLAGMLGQKIVLAGKYDPASILNTIESEKVTFSDMVPSILNVILNHPEAKNHAQALSRWKVVTGGAALPRELALAARRIGIKIMSGYGLSETAPVLTLGIPRDELMELPEEQILDRVLLKAGTPIPLVEVRVVDEKMQDVARDSKSMGEVVVRAPWTTREYYKESDGTNRLWADGWLHTGDIAVMDEKGYVSIVDRMKDVVKSGGEWISTIILEDLLTSHPAVFEAAVIAGKDSKWGERPVAIVTSKQGATVTEEELKKHLEIFARQGTIANFWIPERIVVHTEPLPKTSTGKIDKKPLREKYYGLLSAET
jgi:acyl-CoA synthetase (AMP-forming)/AMP-acid ligase II